MADVGHIRQDSPAASVKSVELMREMNMQTLRVADFSLDAHLNYTPGYFLYLFNIAPKTFKINRPPCFSQITISACPEGQPWALVAKFPAIVDEKWVEADSGEIRTRGIQGERFVMDLINPSNLGVKMWSEVTDEQMSWIDGGTNDYTRRGLFWTRNERPGQTCLEHGGCADEEKCPVCKKDTYSELYLAKARLEKHYKQLIVQADDYSRKGNYNEIGPEHHLAGDYFHVRAPWHIVAELPSTCPNCGDAMKDGMPYHVNSVGIVCVIDWKKTVLAGVKKREDVPEELRWWDEPVKRGPGRPRKEETVEAT